MYEPQRPHVDPQILEVHKAEEAEKATDDDLPLFYLWSEFSRIRAQYDRDESRPQGTDHQLFLQYIMSLGSHGAHEF